MEKKWKILASKKVFEHPRLVLIEEEVLLPSGVKTKYLRYKDTGNAVTIICKRNNGKILLEKEYSHPPKKWLYQFPGGYVPKNENLQKGANRELMEEANYKAGKMKLLGSYFVNNRRSKARMYVFLATDIRRKTKKSDPEEDIRLFWFSERQIDKKIKNGEIINCYVLASWSLYKSASM